MFLAKAASFAATAFVAFSISFAGQAAAQSKLPACPKSQSARFNNCYGTWKSNDGYVYVGEWKNDKQHGFGTATFANGEKYVGEHREGKRSGQGTQTFKDGNKYVGEFKNDKRNGQFTVTYADGDKFFGEFRDDYFNGEGTYIFKNGDKYVGSFRDDKYNGRGTFSFANGNVYVGEYRDGKRNGEFTVNYADGDKYIGSFKDDVFNGFGTYIFSDGDRYAGEFRDDKYNGQGTYTFANGNVYVGEYRDGKRNGHFTVEYANGDRYEGGFSNDVFSGNGVYVFANGDKYEGEFANDKYNGKGIFYNADGTIRERGVYKDNVLAEPEAVEPQQKVARADPKPEAREDNPGREAFTADQVKVALVIGNGAYVNAPELENPRNDAVAMEAMLKSMGFVVVSGEDLDKRAMEQRIREFVTKAKKADVALFFYAGHGLQVAGENYLVPIDASVADETALDFELVNVKMVSTYMGGLDRVGIILLDACRDNPLSRSLARSLGKRSSQIGNGLAAISTDGGGLLVGFATAPGDVASDGTGMNNSPFTTALLKHLPAPGMEIQRIMTRVKAEVIELTKNEQRPWHNSDLAKDVFLSAGK